MKGTGSPRKTETKMTQKETTPDQKISALRKGGSVLLSESNSFQVYAERSGNGETLTIVRHSKDGFQVIKRSKF